MVPQIAVFFLISCVIFLAFAQCFFMAYYASVEGYQTYLQSIMSVLRFTVLDFDYEALSKVRHRLSHSCAWLCCVVDLIVRCQQRARLRLRATMCATLLARACTVGPGVVSVRA